MQVLLSNTYTIGEGFKAPTKMKTVVKILKTLGKEESYTMLGNFQKKKYDPFRILIGTILSARARDEVTEVIAKNLFKRYKNAKQLAKAKQQDVEKIIKQIGFYRNKAKNVIGTAKEVVKLGKVPNTEEGLMALPGVGRKVSGCVLVYAFKKDAIPVDTHVHRISNRLGLTKTKTPEKAYLFNKLFNFFCEFSNALESLIDRCKTHISNRVKFS